MPASFRHLALWYTECLNHPQSILLPRPLSHGSLIPSAHMQNMRFWRSLHTLMKSSQVLLHVCGLGMCSLASPGRPMQVAGTRGDVQPATALGLRLASHGHRVRMVTHKPYKSLVEVGLACLGPCLS